jgi:hypothetical protein
MCVNYAKKLRFNFGINFGENKFKDERTWTLTENNFENVHCMDILCVKFNDNFKDNDHVYSRIYECYRSYYSLHNVGFSYPGLDTCSNVKSYLWKYVCQSVLWYGTES